MRRKLIFPLISLLAVLMALGPFVPTSTLAATSQLPTRQSTTTGTLVAKPQATQPTMLLLQVGGQTISVTLNAGVQLIDAANNAIGLGQLSDGDSLQVVGDPNQSGGIDASLVQDLSLNISTSTGTAQVTGVLASAPSGVLCLQNASVTNNAITPQFGVISACPSGQLPVYLTGGTQFIGPAGQAYSLANLSIGDTLQVSGTLSNSQFTASEVQDLSSAVTPPTTTAEVTGVLASAPSGVLCLQNASVTNNAITPQFGVISACPSGQLPVYLTGGTQFVGPAGQAYSLANLNIGDTLQVSGTLSNSQFTASEVQDLSSVVTPPTSTAQVTGVLASAPSGVLCLQNASVTNNAITPQFGVISACPSGQLPVYLTGGTQFIGPAGQAYSLANLSIGDTLQVSGTLSNSQFTASEVQDLSSVVATTNTASSVTTQLTIQGTLATTPGQLTTPVTLCLQQVRRAGRVRGLQVASGSCAAGQWPLYITGGINIVRRANGTSGLDELRAGDSLQVTGTLSNGLFTVSQIRDLSIQASYTTLVGTVRSINRSRHTMSFTLNTANQGVVTISLQGNTQIIGNGSSTFQASAIQPGQVLTVMGVYNRAGHRYTSTFRVRVH